MTMENLTVEIKKLEEAKTQLVEEMDSLSQQCWVSVEATGCYDLNDIREIQEKALKLRNVLNVLEHHRSILTTCN